MIRVKYYGPLRQLTGVKEEEMLVSRVSEVIKEIGKRHGKEAARQAEKCFIIVNSRNAALINGFRTALNPGDLVQIIQLTGGG